MTALLRKCSFSVRAQRLFPAMACLFCLAVIGCAPYRAMNPEGFAVYRERGAFRAASPEGIVFRVHHTRNQPRAGLSFWREAMHRRMVDAGYRFLSDTTVMVGTDSAAVLELAAPVGELDHGYIVALIVDGRNLVLAESTGELMKMKNERSRILQAIGSIRVR